MRIVIVEDEKLTADNLADTILEIFPDARIIAFLYSVKSAISWFQKNEQPDLIFCDIDMGDGLSFEIFKTISTNVPVIFCTAYDEYALKAFDANGIDYILKPFDKESVQAAFNKYNKLKTKFSEKTIVLEQIIQLIENKKRQNKLSVLVYQKDKILPIRFEDIALFYIENEITHLITFSQVKYMINKTMEEIENISPDDFYRISRQFIINRKAIKEASQYFSRKLSLSLSLSFKDTITVSRSKVSGFLNWLSSH